MTGESMNRAPIGAPDAATRAFTDALQQALRNYLASEESVRGAMSQFAWIHSRKGIVGHLRHAQSRLAEERELLPRRRLPVSTSRMLDELARAHRRWQAIAPPPPAERLTLSPKRPFAAWIEAGGGKAIYAPVRELRALVSRSPGLFSRVILYGSVASCTDHDRSDIDLACILSPSATSDPRALSELYRIAKDIRRARVAFGASTYHECIYLAQDHLERIPNLLALSLALLEGIELLDDAPAIEIARPLPDHFREMIDERCRYLEGLVARAVERPCSDVALIKQTLGYASKLPLSCLFYRFVKAPKASTALPLCEPYFTPEAWAVAQKALRLRATLEEALHEGYPLRRRVQERAFCLSSIAEALDPRARAAIGRVRALWGPAFGRELRLLTAAVRHDVNAFFAAPR